MTNITISDEINEDQASFMDPDIVRISLDLESMSLENNAAIVMIGACTLDRMKHFVSFINPTSAEASGLHVDVGTMEWWDKQDPTVRKNVFDGKETLAGALVAFEGWCRSICPDLSKLRVYCKGGKDWVWLESAYHAVLPVFPFHHRSPCDMRSVKDVMQFVGLPMPGVDSFKPEMPHDALSDAIAQAWWISFCLNSIRTVVSIANNLPQD